VTAGNCDREFAPAKVNLYLHLIRRRDDGYHELDSLVAFADVGDDVSASPAPEIVLTVDGAMAPALDAGEDNLVLAAARALRRATGSAQGANLGLHKRLPVAAGLGGGSADAAAALHLLCRMWRVRPDEATLARLALDLGADVPVCVTGTPARIGGIGERVEPVAPFPATPVVLVNPGMALSTAAVFRATRQRSGVADWPADGFADAEGLCRFLARCGNDLEPAARAAVPAIGDVLAALAVSRGCLLSRMSGSGATCFGLFETAPAARDAAERLRAAEPHWWIEAGSLGGAPA
jgi:4-diphosphocytidyl-2-C-methyl-D-erythritol kinase